MSEFYQSRLFHFAVVFTALIWLFEFVPPSRDVQGQQIPPAHKMVWESLSKGIQTVVDKSPSWLGLWSVYEPTGEFYPLAPSGEEIRREADEIWKYVRALQAKRFFRIFKVDLNKECPFWARQDLCSDGSSCTVCECTEDEIPTRWKEKPTEHFVCRELGVTPWEEKSESNLFGDAGLAEQNFLDTMAGGKAGSYVDLVANPPGFTAYKGRNIWNLIYKENCIRNEGEVFSKDDPSYVPSCSDEDVYDRIISGLQTTVMVLSSEYNKPYTGNSLLPLLTVSNARRQLGDGNQTGRYQYNLDLFRWRVNVDHRWIDNLYFDFSLIVRTLGRLNSIISNCGCYTGTDADDAETSELLSSLTQFIMGESSSGSPKYVNMPIFTRKQDQAITQLHNVSRIFDCIECEKCRLHGKVKLTALQVAVKSLPSVGYQHITSLERNEITALINALAYFSDAIKIIHQMKLRTLALRRLILTTALWICIPTIYFLLSKCQRRSATPSDETVHRRKVLNKKQR